MAEDTSNPNIEWKNKKGFEEKEKTSRRIDLKKVLQSEALDKKTPSFSTPLTPADLPNGLKKIRKKIKDIYEDEEDEEDGYIFLPPGLNNSLMDALNDSEKQQLQQQKNIQTKISIQNAEKAAGLMLADRTSKSLGLKGLNRATINKNMIDATSNSETYENALRDELFKKAKIKRRKLSKAQTINLLRGIKKVQKLSIADDQSRLRALEGWKLEELIEAGQKSTGEKELAHKILTKSGRKKDKRIVKKMTNTSPIKNRTAESDIYKKKELYRD